MLDRFANGRLLLERVGRPHIRSQNAASYSCQPRLFMTHFARLGEFYHCQFLNE